LGFSLELWIIEHNDDVVELHEDEIENNNSHNTLQHIRDIS
jgi:hypothetical protein